MQRPSELTGIGPVELTKKYPATSGPKHSNVSIADIIKTQQKTEEQAPVKPKPKYVVGVDFDGTCVTHEFPKIGKDNRFAVEVLKQIVAHGAGIVLFTMRSGEYLDAAVKWFEEREIPLYGINTNPTQATWTQSPKAYCHLYIDDAALGCPLKHDPEVCKRPFVDWVEVDRMLQLHDWYIEPIQN